MYAAGEENGKNVVVEMGGGKMDDKDRIEKGKVFIVSGKLR